MMFRQNALVRAGDGFDVTLLDEERALLASIPAQLEASLAALADASAPVPDDLRRLFPIAYATDRAAEAAYEQRARAEIAEHHRHALNVLIATATATHISESEAEMWLASLNDLRLVFGTALGVSEDSFEPDDDDPNSSEWSCYRYLTYLQSEVIDAIANLLPPPKPGADDLVPDDPWGEPPGGLRWDGTPLPEDR